MCRKKVVATKSGDTFYVQVRCADHSDGAFGPSIPVPTVLLPEFLTIGEQHVMSGDIPLDVFEQTVQALRDAGANIPPRFTLLN